MINLSLIASRYSTRRKALHCRLRPNRAAAPPAPPRCTVPDNTDYHPRSAARQPADFFGSTLMRKQSTPTPIHLFVPSTLRPFVPASLRASVPACLRASVISLLVLAGCAAPGRGPRERDLWYEYVADGQRYGYEHQVVSKLPDGDYEYRTETRMLMDFLGAGEQEFSSNATYVVTPDYRPLRFESHGKQTVGTFRASGRTDGDKLLVDFERAGIAGNGTIHLTRDAVYSACIADWLHAQPTAAKPARGNAGAGARGDESAQTVNVTLISEDRLCLLPGTLTLLRRDDAGTDWSFDFGLDAGQGTTTYDADGVALETRMRVPKLHIRRCDADDARDITCRALVGRDVLMFPVDKDIGNPERLTALSVKLAWKDIPFEQFELEDARQRIVRKSAQDRRYEAVVRLADPQPVTARISYPVVGDEFHRYLAEDQYIKPRHERIIATARDAVAGRQSALEAVEALSGFVSKYIQGGLIAETLSGPEILECRQGKCSEYSILFASLARAVGIPTRIVLGDRMVAGNWIGHMWNEAYVGEWIPVDASANEVGRSMMLLKFIHSDTVMGTQALRWALTDSLEVTIEEFGLRPSTLAEKYKTGFESGVAGNVYTNVDYACRLTTPASTWKIEEKSQAGVLTVRFRFPDDEGVLVHFVAFAVPPSGIEPKTLIDGRLSMFRKYDDFAELKNELYKVGGATGHTLQFARTERIANSDQRRRMLTTEVVWVGKSSAYLLNLIAQENAHNQRLADYYKLLASFEGLE